MFGRPHGSNTRIHCKGDLLFFADVWVTLIRHFNRSIKVLSLRSMVYSVEVANSNIMATFPAGGKLDMVAHIWVRRSLRIETHFSCLRWYQVLYGHAGLLCEGDVILFRRTTLMERLCWLAVVHVNDPWKCIRAIVAILILERDSWFCRFFVKILTVERMPLIVRFAMGDVPTVVPVLWLDILLLYYFRDLLIDKLFCLVERTACVNGIIIGIRTLSKMQSRIISLVAGVAC